MNVDINSIQAGSFFLEPQLGFLDVRLQKRICLIVHKSCVAMTGKKGKA